MAAAAAVSIHSPLAFVLGNICIVTPALPVGLGHERALLVNGLQEVELAVDGAFVIVLHRAERKGR